MVGGGGGGAQLFSYILDMHNLETRHDHGPVMLPYI